MVTDPLRYLSNLVLQQSADIQKHSHSPWKSIVVSSIWTQILSTVHLDHSRHSVHYLCTTLSNHWTLPKVQCGNTRDRSNWRLADWPNAPELLWCTSGFLEKHLARRRTRLQSATWHPSDKPKHSWQVKIFFNSQQNLRKAKRESRQYARRAQLWHLDEPSLPTKAQLHSLQCSIQDWLRHMQVRQRSNATKLIWLGQACMRFALP